MEGLGPPLIGRDAEPGDGSGRVHKLLGLLLEGEAADEVGGSEVEGEGGVAEGEGGGLRGFVACMLLRRDWER